MGESGMSQGMEKVPLVIGPPVFLEILHCRKMTVQAFVRVMVQCMYAGYSTHFIAPLFSVSVLFAHESS